jgi:hypothetical protein
MKTLCIYPAAVVLLGAVATVLADTRTSANYSLTTESVDSGGLRATSANYRNDASIGGVTGVSSAVAPPETAKHGYIGQLYETVGLALAANPATVNEGSARQITAAATLDDGSTLWLPGNMVQWAVISGPIASVNPGGLATAALVYQNEAASVGGSYLGKSGSVALTVLNVNSDDFGAYAGDGLDDAWQVLYFGLGNPQARPDRDPDLDGQNNTFELIAGTNPTDGNSRFRFRIEMVTGQPTWRNLIFSPRLAGRTYTPLSRSSLSTGAFGPLGGSTSTTDNAQERTVTDQSATTAERYYRIRISMP